MLRFAVFDKGKPATKVDLTGAYLFGGDGVPFRADIEFAGGFITCKKRTAGPAGLALLWSVEGVGRVYAETTRLQERDAPYVLTLELARGQLMRLSHKREEWGLLELENTLPASADIPRAADVLIEALQADTLAEASAKGEQALRLSLSAAEALTRYQADAQLERRRQNAGFTRRVLGCVVDTSALPATLGPRYVEAFDFVTLPVRWKLLEPTEQTYHWKPLDAWVEWLNKHRVPIKGSALVSFQEDCVPDWLYIWEHDFETVREMVTQHLRRVVNRFQTIQVWDVISGIHNVQGFSFNFEQLLELTRMAVTSLKQLAPRSSAIIDIVAPWGEYYARNQRTIPPMLYAEMAAQTGINFDALGLRFCFGVGSEGLLLRDLFQISALLDRFGNLGKPLHVTAVGVPSGVTADKRDAWGGKLSPRGGGSWHGDWNEALQAEWLRRFYEIALSKPFVETVSWRDLSDAGPHLVPHGGLLRADLTPKAAYQELRALRKDVLPDVAGR